MFREFMHPMNWSDCLCERFNFPVKCKGGCCAQGIGAKVRDDENCEYQMEHLLWFEITLALTDVSGRQFSLSTGSDYDYDDDDKVNQD